MFWRVRSEPEQFVVEVERSAPGFHDAPHWSFAPGTDFFAVVVDGGFFGSQLYSGGFPLFLLPVGVKSTVSDQNSSFLWNVIHVASYEISL